MDEVLVRNALNSSLEATKDDATPIIRRLARIQARAALDTLASAPAGDGVGDDGLQMTPAVPDRTMIRAGCAVSLCPRAEVAAIYAAMIAAAPAALARPRAAVGEQDVAFLNDLAARLFKQGSPSQGFDQGDTDQLYRIARILALQSPTAKVEPIRESTNGGAGE